LRHTGVEDDGTLVDNLVFALVPTDPREAVEADVRDGYVTPADARRQYGVGDDTE
jgi:hypothetical protein